jgi:hypothetical protein
MNINIPERYRQARAAVPFDGISIGYDSVHLFLGVELEAAQRGYGIVPEGDETDWQPQWLVVGYEGRCGDPIFVDTSHEYFPVYTAAHGMGEWDPVPIASSFQHFIQILTRLQSLARGRENPVQLDENPVTDTEIDSLLNFIKRGSPDVDLTFWETFCGGTDE